MLQTFLESLQRLSGFLRQHAAHSIHKPQDPQDYYWHGRTDLIIQNFKGCFGFPPPKWNEDLYLEFFEDMSLELLYLITQRIKAHHLAMEDLPHVRITTVDNGFEAILDDFHCINQIHSEQAIRLHKEKKEKISTLVNSTKKNLELLQKNLVISGSISNLEKLQTLVKEDI